MPFQKNALLIISTLLTFTFLILSACAQQTTREVASNSGLGGTGHSFQGEEQGGSGFGGTGHGTQGFGGTGHSSKGFGGTGIIGTISAFGSIWVNGIEIEYDAKTPIENPLNTEKSPLKLGQQVVVETLPNDQATLAKQIKVFIPLAGKISQREGNWLTINQQKVQIQGSTLLDDNLSLNTGDYVAINGYRTASNRWQATRINLNPEQKSWVKPQLPLDFSPVVHKLIIQPALLPMIQGIQQNQQWLNQLKQAHQKHKAKAILLKGSWQGQHFLPQKMEQYHFTPPTQSRPMPRPEVHRTITPSEMREQLWQQHDQQEQVDMMQQMHEQSDRAQTMKEQQEQMQQLQEQQQQNQQMQQLQEQQQQNQQMQQLQEQQQQNQQMQQLQEQQQQNQQMQQLQEQQQQTQQLNDQREMYQNRPQYDRH